MKCHKPLNLCHLIIGDRKIGLNKHLLHVLYNQEWSRCATYSEKFSYLQGKNIFATRNCRHTDFSLTIYLLNSNWNDSPVCCQASKIYVASSYACSHLKTCLEIKGSLTTCNNKNIPSHNNYPSHNFQVTKHFNGPFSHFYCKRSKPESPQRENNKRQKGPQLPEQKHQESYSNNNNRSSQNQDWRS